MKLPDMISLLLIPLPPTSYTSKPTTTKETKMSKQEPKLSMADKMASIAKIHGTKNDKKRGKLWNEFKGKLDRKGAKQD